ncbi:hypothetical protein B7P43_G03376 [Cryptotermes secundus]|uniref:Endonuclease/exonuclease/phosphatase domain-containing protein n=1 Tax=Cryptotermes secundus TaxID=105785 RepID=A0A2J7QDP8_9NEOP|nr:hypothetical protein B7P43_G03376 [Cryptotermes secundus]
MAPCDFWLFPTLKGTQFELREDIMRNAKAQLITIPKDAFQKCFQRWDHYNLGAVYCRKILSKGGVCIFVHNSINYSNINLDRFYIDQIIEICAVKLKSARQNICIVAVYKTPSENFLQFLNSLDRVLNTIYGSGVEFILCGDININYLQDSHRKKQHNSLLSSFNLFPIIDFQTRSQNNSVSLIDNIFIDYSQFVKYFVFPINTGLSDAQLIIRNIYLQIHEYRNSSISTIRVFDALSLLNFEMQLSYEMWDDVFSGNDVDTIFNSFLNTYLRIFHSSFSLKKIMTSSKTKVNNWITPGIKISCRHKWELCLLYRNNNDANLKKYCKLYCRILSSVINAAKRLHYDRLFANSENKIKTTWNIVKSVTGKKSWNKSFESVYINGTLTDNQQLIADSFQNCFLLTADNIISNINNNEELEDNNCIDYLYRVFSNPFPNIIFEPLIAKQFN